MSYLSFEIDVTDALPAEVTAGSRLFVSAWVFVPVSPIRVDGRPVAIALLNGGTYDKRYFHLAIPGRADYSAAEILRDKGYVVILLDHLGVGESSKAPNQMLVTRQVAAAANHHAVRELHTRLAEGSLSPSLPAMPDLIKVGGGHSMGGMQTITQQAEHATYDRILIIGYTAIGVHFSINGQLVPADPGPLDFSSPDYVLADRKMLREGFHWEDVPDDVVAIDDTLLVEVPYVLSGQSISMSIVSEDASRIAVPVYICLGERDVSPAPYSEPSYYTGSPDVTLHILPKSAHCQSFASTRLQMYDRIDRWIRSIPA